MAAAISNKKRGASHSKENWGSLNESGASSPGLGGPNERKEPKPICECMCYTPSNDQSRPAGFFYFQPQAKALYEGDKCQILVAIIISINFLCNVIEKEIDPQGVLQPHVWRKFEITFNVIFLFELIVNMYARWWKPFWYDGWNIFDVVVVAVGCVSFGVELEGPFKLLRCLRAFRVFRLFKRVKSLNRIIVMVSAAIPGVTNAFLVIVIMISIYSIVAVEFFSTFGTVKYSEYTGTTVSGEWDPTLSVLETSLSDQTVVYANLGTGQPSNQYTSNMTTRTPTPTCAYLNSVGALVPSATTRNLCHGSEYWGTFTRAWFSLFQVLTGESWSEAIARPVLFGWDEYGSASIYLSTFFFLSFVVINAFILFNVFIAVLLDKVISGDPDEAEYISQPITGAHDNSALMRDLVGPSCSSPPVGSQMRSPPVGSPPVGCPPVGCPPVFRTVAPGSPMPSWPPGPASPDGPKHAAKQGPGGQGPGGQGAGGQGAGGQGAGGQGAGGGPAEGAGAVVAREQTRGGVEGATVTVDMQVARTVFTKFDVDGSGRIDKSELGGALKSMGISSKDYSSVIDKFDSDKSGNLDFDEFSALLLQIRRASATSAPIKPNQMMMRLMEVTNGLIADQRVALAEQQTLAADVSALKALCAEMMTMQGVINSNTSGGAYQA